MKTTYFKRFTRLFVVMLLAMLPAMSWAQTYISEVAVSCRANVAAAITELESNGYTTIMYDYNHNVPSCTMPGVIIGYKTTSDRTKAITDLMIMEGEKYKCDGTSKQQIVGNKVYRPIKAFGDTYGDFNSGCASTASKLYLWYTKDVTGDPLAITALAGVTNPNTALSDANYVKMFDGSTVTANGDLNKNAGGDFMYIKMNKTKPANATFKRTFTTSTNTNNEGKAYLRFYDIAKYFGIDEPNGDYNVSAVYLTEIKIDGVAYSSYHTGEVQITTSGDKNTFAAGGVTVTTLNSSAANGGTKKTGFPVATSYKYRYEINYPHQNVNEIQLIGYIVVNGERRNWDFILHKEENMYYCTYDYGSSGDFFVPYIDIFRFLGYDVSGGCISSCYPQNVKRKSETFESTLTPSYQGGYEDCLTTRFSDGSYIQNIWTNSTIGALSDAGDIDYKNGLVFKDFKRNGYEYTIPVAVQYSYHSTVDSYLNNEAEEYKFVNIVFTPNRGNIHFCKSATDATPASSEPVKLKANETITLYVHSTSNSARTYAVDRSAGGTFGPEVDYGNGFYSITFTAKHYTGEYTLTVSQAAGNGYFESKDTRSIIVTQDSKIVLKSNTATVLVGEPLVLPFLIDSNKSNYSEASTTFAVSPAGANIVERTFVASKEGTYTVTIKQPKTSIYNASETELTVKVLKEAVMTYASGSVSLTPDELDGKDVSTIKELTTSSDGNVTYTLTDEDGNPVTLTDNCLPSNMKCGTYIVTAYIDETDDSPATSESYRLFVRLKDIKTKPNQSISLENMGYSNAQASYMLTGDNSSDATTYGSTFTSSIEGVYNVDVYDGDSKMGSARVFVSRHTYPYYEFNAHYDPIFSTDWEPYSFTHELYPLCLPAWDFESQVCGKNVRFCINDDEETVTLVAATPLWRNHYYTVDAMSYDDETYHNNPGHSDSHLVSAHPKIACYPWLISFSAITNRTVGSTQSISYTSDTYFIDNTRDPIYYDVNYIDAYCIDAEELVIPETVEFGGKTYTVTAIGGGALPCSMSSHDGERFVVSMNTKSIKLPASIKDIGSNAFRRSHANTVNFNDLVNLETIGMETFCESYLQEVDLTNCKKLKSIGIDNMISGEFTNTVRGGFGKTFMYCHDLKTVNMSGLEELTGVYNSAFENCNSLESLDISNTGISYIHQNLCKNCTSLRLPNFDDSPIWSFGYGCFQNCNFKGQTLDTGRFGDAPDTRLEIYGFTNSGLKNLVIPKEHWSVSFQYDSFTTSGSTPMIENIFVLNCSDIRIIESSSSRMYKRGMAFNNKDFTVNKDMRIFIRYNALTNTYTHNNLIDEDIEDYGDEHGPRVFPILSSNTSGVRTMSYFRPLDYKNIKVFDNTHLYGANKPGGGDYELEDFFRPPENITENNIDMLKPYTATSYNVENKQVTMTPLAAAPGIEAKGGIYYKDTGTSTDGAGNEILYILTEPNYSLVGENKSYTNMYSGVNYLKGGGKESVVLDKAPHMTETSTQFISKGGTFYYSTPGTLAAYKAYLDLPEFIKTAADTDYSSSAKVTSLSFVWEDEPMQESETITSVNAISENRNGDFYNLQGMKVKTPQRSGLYISNGRKVLVK